MLARTPPLALLPALVLPTLVLGALAGPAAADDLGLAAQIESSPSDPQRELLLAQVDALDPAGRSELVRGARRWREENGSWTRLGPALVRIEDRHALAELGAMARTDREGAEEGALAAIAALGSCSDALAVPQLFRGCTADNPRATRQRCSEALVERLTTDRAAFLLVSLVQRELVDEERGRRAAAAAGDLISAAVVACDDPGHLFRAVRADQVPAALAIGLVHGIGERGPRAAHHADSERALLAVLQESDSPAVLKAAFEAIPRLSERLSDTWAPLLIPAVEHPERVVSGAAWNALKRLSGRDLPQSAGEWQRWWERHEQAMEDEYAPE